ncbi:MAG: MmgE/PrpD family protein [Desulfobulbaceae bacterium]|nr:MAG: MmgE/PrpD family protein [Desulfobulbaceae bacterium]
MNLTREIAHLCSELSYNELDETVHDRVKYLLLDYLGVAIRGAKSESSLPLHRFLATRQVATGGVPVTGTNLVVDTSYAALATGTAAHSLELDDVVNAASLHPAVSVMSATLAAGFSAGSTGRDIIAAIVAGYELMVKLGIALNPAAHYQRGFHPTGTCGTFGASVAAAKLFGLDPQQTLHTLGIAGSQAAGSMEFLSDGAYTKRFHGGWSAHSGVLAAQLAKEGFTGPATILEGSFGFLHGYSGSADQKKVLEDWGSPYEVLKTSIKPHACCRYNQGSIDCILRIFEEQQLEIDEIEEIEASILQAGTALVAEPHEQKINPRSVVDAQFSMPFGAAVAVVHKNAFLDQYSLENINDPRIKALMKRVRCVANEAIEKDFPQKWRAAVTVRTKAGETFHKSLEYPRGDPENPLSWEEVIDKFINLAGTVFAQQKCAEIVSTVRKLDQLEDISTLCNLLKLG